MIVHLVYSLSLIACNLRFVNPIPRENTMPRKLVAVALLLVAAVPLAAADPSLDGKWLLTYSAGATGDFAVCILKAETQNGKPTFAVHSAPRGAVTVKEARLDG